MRSTSQGQQGTPYIIRANDTAGLTECIATASKDPDIEAVDAIGPPATAHTVVVVITGDKALALAQEFTIGGSISIERDQLLSPMPQDKS